jgi:hypothetical protein
MTTSHDHERSTARAPQQSLGPDDALHQLPPLDTITVRISVAVRISGIGRTKLYELIRDGRIETIKVGTATLVLIDSLRGFLDSLRRKQPPSAG